MSHKTKDGWVVDVGDYVHWLDTTTTEDEVRMYGGTVVSVGRNGKAAVAWTSFTNGISNLVSVFAVSTLYAERPNAEAAMWTTVPTLRE